MAHSSRRRYGRHCSPPETLYTDYETRRSFYPNPSFIPMCYGLVTTVVQSCISNGGDIMSEPSPFYGLRPIKGLAEEWSINYQSLYPICRKHEIQATKIIGNSRLYGPDEQRAMFAVLQEYGHGLGIDLALYKSLPALDEEVCETEGRHQVWTSHLLQRHEEAIKTLKAEREDFKGRLERLESGNTYTALLGALGKFTETHLCPASLGQWNQMLLTLPQGAITNALRIFQALFADALDLNLA